MSTVILAAICFAAGVMLGSRYKVFVLIPLNFIVAGAAIGMAAADGFPPWHALAATILMIIILQIGYLVGAGFGAAFIGVGEKDDAMPPAKGQRIQNQRT